MVLVTFVLLSGGEPGCPEESGMCVTVTIGLIDLDLESLEAWEVEGTRMVVRALRNLSRAGEVMWNFLLTFSRRVDRNRKGLQRYPEHMEAECR